MNTGVPPLLHIVGYLTGASLFAMLLAMVLWRRGPGDRLTLGTALLGLAWNFGELLAHLADRLGQTVVRDWLAALSYTALGFLAAVVVHAAARARVAAAGAPSLRAARTIGLLSYACAAAAGLMQVAAAARGATLPSSGAMLLVAGGLAALSAALLVATRGARTGRAGWTIALALFAVSAFHLGRFHGASESWGAELLGHHASIPLAFAILYQDYRFAFADLYLKRALTLVSVVVLVFGAWSAVAPEMIATGEPVGAGLLLTVWVATVLAFPLVRQGVTRFVDRIVLARSNYASLLEDLAVRLQSATSEAGALDALALAVGAGLGGVRVEWQPDAGGDGIPIVTTEAPLYRLTIGDLGGGRRLLSDDRVMLERAAMLAGRRIDALRLSDERYAGMLREQEMSALATEAELRALRAQINPHFLFNALTTIAYLIQRAPSRALDTLMRLTTLLRSVLRSEGEYTTLGQERVLVEAYLDIERERFEERLDTIIEIPEALAHVPIPALILQPIVENAIKHGISPARGGGRVRVMAHQDGAPGALRLRLTVANDGVPPAQGTAPLGTGVGIRNVRRRLEGCYGDTASFRLEWSPHTGETEATIVLPLAAPLVEGDALAAGPRRS